VIATEAVTLVEAWNKLHADANFAAECGCLSEAHRLLSDASDIDLQLMVGGWSARRLSDGLDSARLSHRQIFAGR
jgi:hypothetical protein